MYVNEPEQRGELRVEYGADRQTKQRFQATGQDAAAGKATFVGLLGAEPARAKARELVASAEARLERFGDRASVLRQIARFVVDRRS